MTHRKDANMTEAELLRRLGELPRRVEPRNDPWPEVMDRISARHEKRGGAWANWSKLAAAVALAFALGIFLGNDWERLIPAGSPGVEVAKESAGHTPTPNLGGVLTGAEREYQAAFGEFITIGRTAKQLEPATLDAIQRDWDDMLDAESALSDALEQYPNNPWLNKRMLELRERQLSMLQQLAGLDRSSRRTQI